MDDEITFSLMDLIEKKTNRFWVSVNGFTECIELTTICSFEYDSAAAYKNDDGSFNIIIDCNSETYKEYIECIDIDEENIVVLGVLNPMLFLKLIDNEETIKKLLKLETVVINLDWFNLTIEPIIFNEG